MQDTTLSSALKIIAQHTDHLVLSRIPESFSKKSKSDAPAFIASIIDLETMGLNPDQDEIIEIGLLSFSFTNQEGIVEVTQQYNALQEPSIPIPQEITKITGITNDEVKGKSIDWELVGRYIAQSHLIICHNSGFDRNFLEHQTPPFIQAIVQKRAFGCSQKDINWTLLGYESSKLEYLNFKLGFFYDGHRALTDCWATLNLLTKQEGAFDELKANVRKKQSLLCAENTSFEKKDLLKDRGYRWSDGKGGLPKCWYIIVDGDALSEETQWLNTEIYGREGVAEKLKTLNINAYNRYSSRAYRL